VMLLDPIVEGGLRFMLEERGEEREKTFERTYKRISMRDCVYVPRTTCSFWFVCSNFAILALENEGACGFRVPFPSIKISYN